MKFTFQMKLHESLLCFRVGQALAHYKVTPGCRTGEAGNRQEAMECPGEAMECPGEAGAAPEQGEFHTSRDHLQQSAPFPLPLLPVTGIQMERTALLPIKGTFLTSQSMGAPWE